MNRILTECICIRKSETLGILADGPHRSLATVFYNAAVNHCKDIRLTVLETLPADRERTLAALVGHFQDCDALLLLTERSFSHLPSRRKLSRAGLRIASLPGITEESLKRTFHGPLPALSELTRKLADILTIASNGSLTTDSGTDLSFTVKNRKGYADIGVIRNPGEFTNLPAGEAAAAPAARSAEGKLVLDGSFPRIGILHNPVTVTVKEGRAVRIAGGSEAVRIRKMLTGCGREARIIAEIGIGTNPKAKFTGLTLEDEKVFGSVHIGFGNNLSFGGKNAADCHYDAVLLNPTLILDGKVILKHGVFRV
ncbi:aminopeptidase [bacterium]|nr:aminopeptidase [bacterium]